MASYLVQEEDGTSRLTLEDNTGYLLLEQQEWFAATTLPITVTIATIAGAQPPETILFGQDCLSGTFRCRGPQAKGAWRQHMCRPCRQKSRGQ